MRHKEAVTVRFGAILAIAIVATYALGGPAIAISGAPSPQTPASPQPTIPPATRGEKTRTAPPIVREVDTPASSLRGRRHHQRIRHVVTGTRPAIDRPALAGVVLVAPLLVPPQPPHFTVPTPSYLPESLATALTTPPPPIVCRPASRDPDAPDAHLYRERPVVCVPDNP